MTDQDLLIRAICAAPAEDTPRLAYADWCEEHGVRWHAELIRLQCGGASNQKMAGYRRRMQKDENVVLEMRDQFLINEHFRFRVGDLGRASPGSSRAPLAHVERGFVWSVVCQSPDFFTHLDDIFRRHPIQRVYLWDRQPMGIVAGDGPGLERFACGYYREGEPPGAGRQGNALPAMLFDRLPPSNHPTKLAGVYTDGTAALVALNVACLRLGRERRAELWAA